MEVKKITMLAICLVDFASTGNVRALMQIQNRRWKSA